MDEESSQRSLSSHQVVVDVKDQIEDVEDDDDVRKPLNDPKREDEEVDQKVKASSSPVNITCNIAVSKSVPRSVGTSASSDPQVTALNGTKGSATALLRTKSSMASGSMASGSMASGSRSSGRKSPLGKKSSPGKVSISLKDQSKSPDQESGRVKRQSILLKRGDTDLSIDQTSWQRFLPSFMQFAFADSEAEVIYQEYYSNEKRSDFHILIKILLLTTIILLSLFSLTLLLSPSSSLRPTDVMCLLSLAISLSLVGASGFLCSLTSSSSDANKGGILSPSKSGFIWSILPVVMWTILLIHIACDLWLYPVSRLPSDSISWVLLYTYIIYVIFPIRFRYCWLLSFLLSVFHVLLISTSSVQVPDFKSQLVSNLILFTCVNILGIMSFFFYERQQRRSFLETCQSLEAKLVLEEESQEQVRY